jgi:hypothetical protein
MTFVIVFAQKYRCVGACVPASAHAVVDPFTVRNCGSVGVGFAQSVHMF